MIISLIVAIGKNREIGLNNKMLWHISEDFKHFKKTTMGHLLVMGRKTFESIGRPLPGRTTLILTRDMDFKREDCLVAHHIDEVIELARKRGDEEVFIAGGADIYRQFLPLCQRLYLSRVDFEGPADTFFPDYSGYDWQFGPLNLHESSLKSPAWSFQLLSK